MDKVIYYEPKVWVKSGLKSYIKKNDSIGTYFTAEKKYYNEKKQLIKIDSFYPSDYQSEGGLSETRLFAFDERGNCIETKVNYTSSPEMIMVNSKEYD